MQSLRGTDCKISGGQIEKVSGGQIVKSQGDRLYGWEMNWAEWRRSVIRTRVTSAHYLARWPLDDVRHTKQPPTLHKASRFASQFFISQNQQRKTAYMYIILLN